MLVSSLSPKLQVIRKTLLQKAQQESEREIAPFPFYVHLHKTVELHQLETNQKWLEYEDGVIRFLEENFQKENYVAFPSLSGRYSWKANGVHFKHNTDAVYFKLIYG